MWSTLAVIQQQGLSVGFLHVSIPCSLTRPPRTGLATAMESMVRTEAQKNVFFFSLTLIDIGYRIAQVKVVFKLPQSGVRFQSLRSKHFAYVEWFSPFKRSPEPHHGLYRVSRNTQRAHREVAIIEVSKICQSVQLFPCFIRNWRVDWTPDSVLEKCDTFFVNALQNRQSYLTVY
jgi:hypothetical protein